MRAPSVLLCACLLLPVTEPALAESCHAPERPARRTVTRRTPCPPAERPVPYDPDRARAGRTSGFIDLGGGMEIRIGGRARLDYDVRR